MSRFDDPEPCTKTWTGQKEQQGLRDIFDVNEMPVVNIERNLYNVLSSFYLLHEKGTRAEDESFEKLGKRDAESIT